MRRFLLSLAFIGLILLAFNPFFVVKFQEALDFSAENDLRDDPEPKDSDPKNISDPRSEVRPHDVVEPEAPAETVQPESPIFPETAEPDTENLPHILDYQKIAKNDTWIGSAPCGEDIFDPPESLTGLGPRKAGPLLTRPMSTSYDAVINNQPTYLYKSKSGITLKLVHPLIQYYDVSGRQYRDAKEDIFGRQPLKALREGSPEYSPEIYDRSDINNSGGSTRGVVAGDIFSPTSLQYALAGVNDRFRIVIGKTVMTSAYMVTLPRWKNYKIASPEDKAKWDDFFCYAAHHELGHLRIRLDIMAETLEGYASLPPASSFEEMEEITTEYKKTINAHIQDRQDAYHIYNGGGTRRGMIELPYAELPFPWLETALLED